MLDLIFTIGQAGCALLLLYGAYLVVMPARRKSNPAVEEQAVMRGHMLYDA